MIDVKEAVAAAARYSEYLGLGEKELVSLEEVEISDDENLCYITLGYQEGPLGTLGLPGARKYKVFTVDAKDGKIRAMKMRKP
ncbi:MAG: hypothetical protein AB1646_12145 [Thermodesulfobacteriota bacterium]